MKTLILAAFLVLVSFGAANAQKVPSTWVGTYEAMESDTNATDTRSFTTWAKLEINCEGGYCIGEYSDGENSDTYYKFTMTIEGTADSISLNYLSCQATERDGDEGCKNEYKKGDLMFKLVNGKPVKGKPTLTTVWGKFKKAKADGTYFAKTAN